MAGRQLPLDRRGPRQRDAPGRTDLYLLVISLWRSRGYERDGVEVKVSVADWRRVEKDHAKSAWWWEHVHRFWVAVTAKIAATVRDDLPTGWSLLACTSQGVKVLVKAEKHAAADSPLGTYVGLLRAASGAGFNALHREYERGRVDGERLGRSLMKSETGESAAKHSEDLRAAVARFEEASGVTIGDRWNAGEVGAHLAVVMKFLDAPDLTVRSLARQATRLSELSGQMKDLTFGLERLGRPPTRWEIHDEGGAS